MTGKEFREKYTPIHLKRIAEDIGRSVMIRTYVNGNSHDERRDTIKEERVVIRNLAYGAMLAYRNREEALNGILDAAEFSLRQFIPDCNTYDTIYIPIRKITETDGFSGWEGSYLSGHQFVVDLKENYGLLEAYRMAKQYLEMQKDREDDEEKRFCSEIENALHELELI